MGKFPKFYSFCSRLQRLPNIPSCCNVFHTSNSYHNMFLSSMQQIMFFYSNWFYAFYAKAIQKSTRKSSLVQCSVLQTNVTSLRANSRVLSDLMTFIQVGTQYVGPFLNKSYRTSLNHKCICTYAMMTHRNRIHIIFCFFFKSPKYMI